MLTLAVVALVCGTVLLIGHRAERVLSARWNVVQRRHVEQALDVRQIDDRRLDLQEHAASVTAELAARRVAALEREIALKERQFEQQTKRPDAPVQMPPDLVARVAAWGTSVDEGEDPFAQENERQVILSLYAEFGDWDTVRAKLVPLNAGVLRETTRDGMVQ